VSVAPGERGALRDRGQACPRVGVDFCPVEPDRLAVLVVFE
jgi:hypothetical protein